MINSERSFPPVKYSFFTFLLKTFGIDSKEFGVFLVGVDMRGVLQAPKKTNMGRIRVTECLYIEKNLII